MGGSMIHHITDAERALAAKVAELTAENAKLLRAWDATLAIANEAKPLVLRLAAERDSLRADAEKWRARQARNKALIDRGFLGSPLRADAEKWRAYDMAGDTHANRAVQGGPHHEHRQDKPVGV